MDRRSFEELRDLPGKVIEQDIKFSRHQALSPTLVAEDVRIETDADISLVMTIQYNPMVGSKTINVHVPGIGPICRLDVDGSAHRPAGRSHKHSLQTERCPRRNLPDRVIDRPDLAGKPLSEVFSAFCKMAKITLNGAFEEPSLK